MPAADKGKELIAYTDTNQIASRAKDAMTMFVKAGIDGKLTPAGK